LRAEVGVHVVHGGVTVWWKKTFPFVQSFVSNQF
jgi:hypothetical protein